MAKSHYILNLHISSSIPFYKILVLGVTVITSDRQ